MTRQGQDQVCAFICCLLIISVIIFTNVIFRQELSERTRYKYICWRANLSIPKSEIDDLTIDAFGVNISRFEKGSVFTRTFKGNRYVCRRVYQCPKMAVPTASNDTTDEYTPQNDSVSGFD